MRRNILKHPVCVQTGKTTYKIYYLQVKLEELYILDIFFSSMFFRVPNLIWKMLSGEDE